ncbi:MAG: flagellar motor switch protein FliM [Planctomycetaceae bacterium]|jgi:flagellar motor switch protein FliM|nr:flagellar motor switch protein FliM [Planctomycetaceae bacterium]
MGAEVLNQSDIDALLNAVNSPEPEAEAPPTQIFSRARRDREKIEIRPYDFKRPERISKDQMRALEMLHETFARNLGASLSSSLRTIVEVRVSHATQMTYSEFIGSLPNPTSFNLVRCPPLEGQICLEVSPLVIYPIIDRLLGGSNKELFVPQRPMTLIETRLIQKILHRALTGLGEAWQSIRKIDFTLGEMESNPQLVQIVPPNEVVVVIGFEVKMTNRAGPMSLCIPYNAIEPLVEDLSAQSWFVTGKNGGESNVADRIADGLSGAKVDLEATLATTTISLGELRNLEVGDLIVTSRPAASPVALAVEGRTKFMARLGQFRGKRALQIQRAIAPTERVDLGRA